MIQHSFTVHGMKDNDTVLITHGPDEGRLAKWRGTRQRAFGNQAVILIDGDNEPVRIDFLWLKKIERQSGAR